MKQEYIICAAILFQDGIEHVHQPKNIKSGIVVCGRRHHNCFAVKHDLNPDLPLVDHIQGFVTSEDRFVSRKEAYHIAITAGQCKDCETECLMSEDLY